MAWGIFLYNKKAGAVLLVLASLHGVTRIYVGVHYPLDILCGMLVGLGVALFFTMIFKLINPLVDRLINLARFFFLA
jgi:undecaprenyl-diphosphatase